MESDGTFQLPDLSSTEGEGYGKSIFDHGCADEDERLALIEEEQDPYTISRIDALGPKPNWKCLEIGAGKGSMAVWLADRCPEGRVVAIDMDTRLFDAQGRKNIEVIEHDVANVTFDPGSFDLVHARGVLTHAPDPEAMCRRMAGWVRPGGWLFISDPASFPVDSSPHPLMRKIGQASAHVMKHTIGTDSNWSRTYPAPLIRAGLVEVDAECRLRMMQGGKREARMFNLMLGQIAQPMISMGLVSAEEVSAARAQLLDPSFVDFPPAVVRAWGRSPRCD